MRVFISTLACLILDITSGAALKPRRLDEGQPVLTASGFVPYPGYSGNLAVAGTVSIATAGTTQTIAMAFAGLDAACANGAGPAGNSCGVHIRSGKTCSDASLVGGHYFTGAVTADPWTSVAYTSADGTYASSVTVTTGGDAAAVAGRAFIVHGYDGGRIGCALLGEGATLSAGPFKPYPGYSGNLAVSGAVSQMVTAGTTQTFDLSFTGLDTACAAGAGPAGNSCGVHIHSGSSCSDASLVGGHYFAGAVTADPWTSVAYASADGTLTTTLSVETGGAAADVLGRAFVVHGHDGGRIACALLTEGPVLTASGFVRYPGYSGNLAVAGTVSIATAGTTQTIAMAFIGLDAACAAGAGTAGNSCGVHIHSGKTCSDASLVGGHYFAGAVTADPWTSVAYTSADGTFASSVPVTTGGDAAAVAGRAFIVHGYDGGRIGCALLLGPSSPSPAPPSPSAPSAPSAPPQDGSWREWWNTDLKTWQRIAISSGVIGVPALIALVLACYCCRKRCSRGKVPTLYGKAAA